MNQDDSPNSVMDQLKIKQLYISLCDVDIIFLSNFHLHPRWNIMLLQSKLGDRAAVAAP